MWVRGACVGAGCLAVLSAIQPAAAVGPVEKGRYECWFFNQPQAGMNFAVTGDGRYSGAKGDAGRFTLDGASGRMAFTGGPLDGALPDGFRAIYVVRKGRPTVSFVSPRGSEAAFCERV